MIHITQMNDAQLSWAYGAACEIDVEVAISDGGDPTPVCMIAPSPGMAESSMKPFSPLTNMNLLKSFWAYPNSGCRMIVEGKHQRPTNAIGDPPSQPTFGFLATVEGFAAYGKTAAQAMCRVVVYRAFGQTVDLPDELMPQQEETESDDL